MSKWFGKRVLVTGSSGVIGRVLVKELVRHGAIVLSVDKASGYSLPEDVEHIEVDLSIHIPSRISAFQPNVVFHLAAAFERAIENPGYWTVSFNNNALLSHNLLNEVFNIESVQTFVFASSYLIYDPSQYLNRQHVKFLSETDTVRPRNLVGAAKYLTEQELDFVDKVENKFQTISARIFRVYGRGSRDVISRWVRSALTGESIHVYNGEGQFDYIFADDVAEGLIRLAESDASGIVNLGYGKQRSVNDIAGVLNEKFPLLEINHSEWSGHIEAECASMSYFFSLTGWRPQTSLEEGIEMLISYERERLGL